MNRNLPWETHIGGEKNVKMLFDQSLHVNINANIIARNMSGHMHTRRAWRERASMHSFLKLSVNHMCNAQCTLLSAVTVLSDMHIRLSHASIPCLKPSLQSMTHFLDREKCSVGWYAYLKHPPTLSNAALFNSEWGRLTGRVWDSVQRQIRMTETLMRVKVHRFSLIPKVKWC